MSHTNSTSHYSLPQFVGTDIPTWLGDFNSAMTAIDSGINAAATTASGAATDAATALKSANDALEAANRCPFPVGFGGFFQTDPNSIYSGTKWEQKKDVFILASGTVYPAGSTGGEAKHVLTKDEMPSHIHYSTNGWSGLSSNRESTDTFLTFGKSKSDSDKDGAYHDGRTGLDSTLSSAGGNKAHNNMPPYYAMPFWIRTA